MPKSWEAQRFSQKIGHATARYTSQNELHTVHVKRLPIATGVKSGKVSGPALLSHSPVTLSPSPALSLSLLVALESAVAVSSSSWDDVTLLP